MPTINVYQATCRSFHKGFHFMEGQLVESFDDPPSEHFIKVGEKFAPAGTKDQLAEKFLGPEAAPVEVPDFTANTSSTSLRAELEAKTPEELRDLLREYGVMMPGNTKKETMVLRAEALVKADMQTK